MPSILSDISSLTFFVCAALFTYSIAQAQQGLTGRVCSTQNDCIPMLSCKTGLNGTECSPGKQCFCYPPDSFFLCDASSQCPSGEACMEDGEGVSNCADCILLSQSSSFSVVDGECPAPSGSGRTGDDCSTREQCALGRRCLDFSGLQARFCSTPTGCFCAPGYTLEFCNQTSDCTLDGEVCVFQSDSVPDPFCASCNYVSKVSTVTALRPSECDVSTAPSNSSTPSNSSRPSPSGNFSSSPQPTNSPRSSVSPIFSPESSLEPVPSRSAGPTPDGSSASSPSPISPGESPPSRSVPSVSPSPTKTLESSPPRASPTGTTEDDGSGPGNFAPCSATTPCGSGRTCALRAGLSSIAISNVEDCGSSSSCFCVPTDTSNYLCETSSSCLKSDRCTRVSSGSSASFSICIACSGPSDDSFQGGVGFEAVDDGGGNCEVCIAASMLTAFSSDKLVYKEHRRAYVLCDSHGSCATDGHIVTYKDVPMMMKTYCALNVVTCSRVPTVVNNPRMRRGLRIPSRTEGLEFTALAARYMSSVEERILSALIRVGA